MPLLMILLFLWLLECLEYHPGSEFRTPTTNSYAWGGPGFVSMIGFLLLGGHIFLLPVCLVVSCGMPSIVTFPFLGAESFLFISIVLSFVSGCINFETL